LRRHLSTEEDTCATLISQRCSAILFSSSRPRWRRPLRQAPQPLQADHRAQPRAAGAIPQTGGGSSLFFWQWLSRSGTSCEGEAGASNQGSSFTLRIAPWASDTRAGGARRGEPAGAGLSHFEELAWQPARCFSSSRARSRTRPTVPFRGESRTVEISGLPRPRDRRSRGGKIIRSASRSSNVLWWAARRQAAARADPSAG